MLKFYKILFLVSMTAGTLITISSYSWLSMWMGLEINLLSIIPLLKSPNNQFPTEASFKYFITQSIASTAFLFSMILSFNKMEQILQLTPQIVMIILYASILTKMGAAPFHAWLPEVLEGLSWKKCLLMLTWQKIAPMIILMQNIKLSLPLISITIFSSAVGSILALNQISMRKIMAYSSINHSAWMISSMISMKMIWYIYFLIYSLISITIMMMLNSMKTFFIHQINIFKLNKATNLIFTLNFLSLGGLPPFLGFLPKWLTINFLIYENNYLLTMFLILFTLVALFVYTRIIFSSMMLSLTENNIMSTKKMSNLMITLNFIILSGLLMSPLILNL
uniref:NADH-ubiquinone oxidoreductase chain 2 n=1 Tax=Trichochrysea japana TaxID=3073295 RepID=A0AA51RGT2_9CUCU|nr:NADH dehydrogenase subunit 2 [Trichochrysea japana]WMQ75977.1 NADH dehydrogenase subunit 2 [Trichochrysea japana]